MGQARCEMGFDGPHPSVRSGEAEAFRSPQAGDNHLQLHPQRARSRKTRAQIDRRWPPPLHARPRPDLLLHRTERPLSRLPMTTQASVVLISQLRRRGHVRTKKATRLQRDRKTPHALYRRHERLVGDPDERLNQGWLITGADLLPLACRLGVSRVYRTSWRASSPSPFQATRAEEFLLLSYHTESAEA